MKVLPPKTLCAGLALCTLAESSSPRQRCAEGDPCWPSASDWQTFNSSLSGGHLVRSVPSAAVCHDERYDADLCAIAKENWENSFWRTNQTGAYSAISWELGDGRCFIDAPREAPCDQGLVPYYSVVVAGVDDIQTAVKFAQKHDLYLTVRNTGHDHLGRSSGKGSFAIWTHNLKGKTWHDSFVPTGAPRKTPGVSAVTLQAGEQWWDVYQAAAEQGVIVVGGSARTVGSAGGYLTGGGHSPFSHFYGLAVDNLLEVNLVDAKGKKKTINQYSDPDHFYAIRGGGGNAWGVITSVTYKTHPNPSHIQVAVVQFNATSDSATRTVLETALKAVPRITEGGYTGYATLGVSNQPGDPTFQSIHTQANGTNATFNNAFAPLIELAELSGIEGQVISYELPSWIDYCNTFLTDPHIATNVLDASRLLTPDALLYRTSDIVDLLFEYPEHGAGFNFMGKVNSDERDNTAVHPVWKNSCGVFSLSGDWEDDAPAEEKRKVRKRVVEVSKRLGEIVGEDGGTYTNEANAYDNDWKKIFWGPNYDRLLKIKKRIDPDNIFVCNRCVGSDIVYEP